MPKRIPGYVFAIAIYPPLALLAENIREVEITSAWRAVLASLFLGTLVFAGFRLILRDDLKAGLSAGLFTVVFFSYGHLYQLLEAHPILGVNLGRHRYLLPCCLTLLGFGLAWIARRPRFPAQLTRALNLSAFALIAMPLLGIGGAQLSLARSAQANAALASELPPLVTRPGTDLPDIYYIILDTYSRQDILLREYAFENEPFLAELRKMGFVVGTCSRSNYGATHTSLASSLNLDYLPELARRLGKPALDKDDYASLIKHSVARRSLSAVGYKTVAFDTGFEWTRLTDADYYLGPGRATLGLQRLEPFEALLVKTTAVLALTDARQQFLDPYARLVDYPFDGHIRRQLFILDQLPEIGRIPEPTFTFAHILIPHTPHIFAADGSIQLDSGYYGGHLLTAINEDYWRRGYVNEVRFANQRVLEIVAAILAESATPPVIILQGDTGVYPSGDTSGYHSILNAYFLPPGGQGAIYPSITPVNSYRLIFDRYFGTSYGLLPDRSYADADSVTPIAETSDACRTEGSDSTQP